MEWFTWALRICRALQTSAILRPVIVTAERFRPRTEKLVEDSSVQIRYMDVSLLNDTLGLDGHDLVARLAIGQHPEIEDILAGSLSRALAGENVDVVISWSSASFYQKLFPSVRIIYSEYAPFNKPPFTPSWYLDPVGPEPGAFLNKFGDFIIASTQETQDKSDCLEDLRQIARSTCRYNTPYSLFLKELRSRYSRLLLLPLQSVSHYMFSSKSKIATSQELVWSVAAAVTASDCLIVTMHPFGDKITLEQQTVIKSHFPNVCFAPLLPREFGSSEYIAPEVDAIISVSSKVAFLSLFYGLPFIAMSDSFGSFFAASRLEHGFPQLGNWAEPAINRQFLYWLLTRYNVPEEVFFSGDWLEKTLTRLVTWRINDPDPFDVIETSEAIKKRFERAAVRQKPVIYPGQLEVDLPVRATEMLSKVTDTPLGRRREGGMGNAVPCTLIREDLETPALILSPGAYQMEVRGSHPSSEADIISFDFCLDRADSDWVPLVWVGDPSATWETGRVLALYYCRETESLIAAIGTKSASMLVSSSADSRAELGRWYSVKVCADHSRSTAIIIVDGVVVSVDTILEGALPPPSHMVVGADLHFPEVQAWAKIANLRASWICT
jgi:hypothetical protein